MIHYYSQNRFLQSIRLTKGIIVCVLMLMINAVGIHTHAQDAFTLSKSLPVVYRAAVTTFTLVNAETGTDIQQLQQGDELNLGTLPTTELSIRANTSPTNVGSVVFDLSGQETHHEIDHVLPYALFGGVTNYN